MNPSMEGLSILVALFVGGFAMSYMRKKGENLATHEDIEKLVEQVQAVTKATKEIEATISNDLWNRRKKWEMKKEALYEVTKELSSFQDVLQTLSATYEAAAAYGTTDAPEWINRKGEAVDAWNRSSASFNAARVRANLVGSDEVRRTLTDANRRIRDIANAVFQNNPNWYDIFKSELLQEVEAVMLAVRRELGIDDPT